MNSRKPGESSQDQGVANWEAEITRIHAVERLMAEFAYRVDFEQGLKIAEMFSPDGYYELDGKRSTGRAAIHEAYVRRAARGTRTARHMFTNIRLVRLPGGKYGATAIMLLFARDGEGVHPAVPLSVSDVTDVYAPEGQSAGDGLPLIESRTLRTVFADKDQPPQALPLGHETR